MKINDTGSCLLQAVNQLHEQQYLTSGVTKRVIEWLSAAQKIRQRRHSMH